MKKNLVALLLVLAVVSVGLFATPLDNSDESFTVTTTVSGINKMIISTGKYVTNPANVATFEDLVAFNNLSVAAGGSQGHEGVVAYISTLSNYRKGYKVTMTATAMKCAEPVGGGAAGYINYTVTVDGNSAKQIITNSNDLPGEGVVVIDTGVLTNGLAAVSLPIALTVDAGEFNAAVQGSYTGTVTFEWTANS